MLRKALSYVTALAVAWAFCNRTLSETLPQVLLLMLKPRRQSYPAYTLSRPWRQQCHRWWTGVCYRRIPSQSVCGTT